MNRKLHIVVDARMIDASGIGVYLRNILDNVVDVHEVTLLGNPDKLAQYRLKAEIIPFLSKIYSIKEQLQLPKIIPACNLFWSPHYNVPLLPVKAQKRIVTIHDVFHLAFAKQLSLAQRVYAKVVINAAVKLSKHILTVSEFSRTELIQYTGCEASKVSVIYNGVNHTRQYQSFEMVCHKYQLPVSYILYVGNVKPHKNLKKLLEAYLLLNSVIREKYKVVIVGKKDGFITGDQALFNWVEHEPLLADNIIFTGFVDDADMDTIYHNASLFVFPSIYEGFGLPPLEAMENGCPVVTSNIGPMPEICDNAAICFDPLDTLEISKKIDEVLTNDPLANQLRNKGKARSNMFHWDRSAQQHLKIFDEIFNY